jgi:hypothetical protein
MAKIQNQIDRLREPDGLLAVLLPAIRLGPSKQMDATNGVDFVALSRKPPARSPLTPSGNLLKKRGKSPTSHSRFYLAVGTSSL